MQRINHAPEGAYYIGSTEGPDQMSEATADAIGEAMQPAYLQDSDGVRHYFDLFTTEG